MPSMILADNGESMMFFLSEFLQTRLVRLNVNSFVRYSSCSSAEAKVIGLGWRMSKSAVVDVSGCTAAAVSGGATWVVSPLGVVF